MSKRIPLVLRTDSYKFSHYRQYPPNTTTIFSYLESRGGKYDKTLFFGLQYYLKEYLTERITKEQVDYAAERCEQHGVPFNKEGFMYIVNEHGGKLPLRIRAVREGTMVPFKNALMTLENTDDKCFWLTNYMETILMKVWYPITVATTSKAIKTIIKGFLERTGCPLDGLPFMLHDFGDRGVSSEESAGLGGLSHLVNFMGTDTFQALEFGKDYYNEVLAGFSIPATEQSTITSWGKANEKAAFKNFLMQYKDNPIVACVSDSFDVRQAAKYWGELKDIIKANGQKLVFRPDSGNPVDMSLMCCELMEEQFGSTKNEAGFKVLNNIGIIYGDGITDPSVVAAILQKFMDNGYAASNLAFGMGGGLLQKVDRDTQEFALKCSATIRNGEYYPVFKDPIDIPSKKSRKGFLDLIINDKGEYETVESNTNEPHPNSQLVTVFENGELLVDYSLAEIRERSDS